MKPSRVEQRYVAQLQLVWSLVDETILLAIEPLLRMWPKEKEDGLSRADARGRTRRRYDARPGVTVPPVTPFSRPQIRPISQMTNAEIRALWPDLSPELVRSFAPWATSYYEVQRITGYAGEAPNSLALQDRVRRAIEHEVAARQVRGVRAIGTTEPPDERLLRSAFRSRPTPEELRPLLFNKGEILRPPVPTEITNATIQGQMAWARMQVEALVSPGNLGPLLNEMGNAIDTLANVQPWGVMPINLRRLYPGSQRLIDHWRTQNISLIRSAIGVDSLGTRVRPDMITELSDVIEAAHTNGVRVENLADEIRRRFEVGEARAELIARDQVLKLNGQINQSRQQSAGVTHYRWRAVKDGRTRDRHRELDGTVQSWDNPPDVGDGRHEHPGGDYQCRCRAEPILEEYD